MPNPSRNPTASEIAATANAWGANPTVTAEDVVRVAIATGMQLVNGRARPGTASRLFVNVVSDASKRRSDSGWTV